MEHDLIRGGFLVLTRHDGSVMAIRPEDLRWVEGGGPEGAGSTVGLDDQDGTQIECVNLVGDILNAMAILESTTGMDGVA